jgi:mono/diheme cytochrome c family protein
MGMKRMEMAIVVLMLGLAANAAHAQSMGEIVYKAKCQSCHGSNGAAETSVAKTLGVKPLNALLVKMSETTMTNVVLNGSGKMPAFKDKLSDFQLKALIAYVDELQEKK